MRILVVDDNDVKREEIVNYLISMGASQADVEQADDCMGARKRLASESFSLLILDVRIPNRKGCLEEKGNSLALLEEIKTGGYLKKPGYIIGITAFDDGFEEVRREFKSYFWDVIRFSVDSNSWMEELKACYGYVADAIAGALKIEYGIDVCVLTALDKPEYEAIMKLPFSWGVSHPVADTLFVKDGVFKCGDSDYKIAAASIGRMGSINSAVAALTVITSLRPRLLLMTGICAAADEADLKFGDVVVASIAWDGDAGKIKDGKIEFEPRPYRVPEWLVSLLRSFIEGASFSFDSYIGAVVSGAKVIADKNYRDGVVSAQSRKIFGIEMEIAGLYAAANGAPRPRPTVLGVKGVCDYATSDKDSKYQPIAARNSAEFIKTLLEQHYSELRDKAGTM